MAGDLRLTYAGFIPYLDRTRALEFGEVSPRGIDLEIRRPDWRNDDLFGRMALDAEFDVAEMSTCMYMMMRAGGDERLIGIPVFVSRAFRHNMIFVRTEAGIDSPHDLKGKRVGLLEYEMTAGLWVRALLEHDYGVKPSDIEWWYGGYYEPGSPDRPPYRHPSGVAIKHNPGKALRQMFLDGEVDALLTFDARFYKALAPCIRRLFPNFREVEREYYRRTALFPIMHTVVIRRDVYEANPWVATAMLEAFIRSKRLGMERLNNVGALAVALPWLDTELDEVAELFGGDPFPYGFEQNRKVLDAMTTYAHEQELTGRKLSPEELFAMETLDHPGDAVT